ncbi:hypothetical protein ERJ75_001584400 [Trypanosoma vivax]|nr:hypothetical protein TRVL_08307 [Trypanosoma vivax]KAH8605836.1 hypothetical protein ERJ75_001584400 [Trypanosoma vivax]
MGELRRLSKAIENERQPWRSCNANTQAFLLTGPIAQEVDVTLKRTVCQSRERRQWRSPRCVTTVRLSNGIGSELEYLEGNVTRCLHTLKKCLSTVTKAYGKVRQILLAVNEKKAEAAGTVIATGVSAEQAHALATIIVLRCAPLYCQMPKLLGSIS